MESILPGKYQHFKGGRYYVLMVAKHSETQEPLVVYVSLTSGDVFARPLAMWTEEVLWPGGEKRSRFVPEDEAAIRQSISTNLADI
jgi:hypothetical protein